MEYGTMVFTREWQVGDIKMTTNTIENYADVIGEVGELLNNLVENEKIADYNTTDDTIAVLLWNGEEVHIDFSKYPQ